MTFQFNPMTGARGIEWSDATVNATGGCMHGCKWLMPDGTVAECWAKGVAEEGVAKRGYPHGFEHHYFREPALKQMVSIGGGEPMLLFIDSMSDLFEASVPEEDVRRTLEAVAKAPHHTYQSLTKAAPQLLKYTSLMPPNLWVGVSSPPDWFKGNHLSQKQQKAMLRKALEVLHEVRERTGCIAWMSAEPVSWDLASVIDDTHPLDWIVIGAASIGRKYYQPDPEHIRKLLVIMDATMTPVFYKGNIKEMFSEHNLGTTEMNRWREDFPLTYRDGTPIAAVARRQEECRAHGWTQSREYARRR